MIHKYRFKDNYILLDVNSGAIHQINELVYDLLDIFSGKDKIKAGLEGTLEAPKDLYDKYSQEDIKEGLGDLDYLVQEGYLFTEPTFSKEQFEAHGERVVKAICLHVAHDCNMNCRYCFGDQGAFEGIRSLMSFDTGKCAIDYLLAGSGNRHNLEVDFFGGEPLMNFEVVKQLVAYGREKEKEYNKHIRFTITTNGILLDEEKTAFINQHMDNVILSIDGRQSVNDKMRRTWNDKGTHDIILDNYLKFVKTRGEQLYYVRGTFTRENLDFGEDVKYLLNKGFKNVSVEPVVVSDDMEFAIRKEDLSEILAEYDRLTDYYIQCAKAGKKFDFFHFNIDLEQGPCVVKRVSGCGAGSEYMAVSPEGDLYPCHQFVGNPKFLLGNLHDLDNIKKTKELGEANIFTKEKCIDCWAKFYCSGGCHANAYNTNGSMMMPYELGCEMEKKRVECAIGAEIQLGE